MVHHLWERGSVDYPYRLGAVTTDQLEQIIVDNGVIPASDWTARYLSGFAGSSTCLSFDDRLVSQRLVIPVLRKYGLDAFFFCPTKDMYLEKERYFIDITGVDAFYEKYFFDNNVSDPPKDFLSEFSFYTDNDRKYRFFRNNNAGLHEAYMTRLLSKFDYPDLHIPLTELHESGVAILGLHSHSHPTVFRRLPAHQQITDYSLNYDILSHFQDIYSVAHPVNSYGFSTLKWLSALGIKVGFRANSEQVTRMSELELPRIDIATLNKQL